MDVVTMQHDKHTKVRYSTIAVILATPAAILIGMLVMGGSDQAVPAMAAATVQSAAASESSTASNELFDELKNRGHTDASAAMLAAKFTSAFPDPARRRELALLASQLSTSLRWSDDEAAARVIAAAAKGQDAVNAMAPAKR